MRYTAMNKELEQFPVYALSIQGEIIPMPHIKSIEDYNHVSHQIHHYIPKSRYYSNPEWYKERGINQKLFLVPVWLHKIIHNDPGLNVSDEEFEKRFKISRWELVFNRKYSKC